jgi:hypothetical protein
MFNLSDENFTKLLQLIVALSSLIVSIVALRLSRKVSLKKNLKDRQFDLVCQLINDISSEFMVFRVQYSDGNSSSHIMYLYQFKTKDFKEKYKVFFVVKHFVYMNINKIAFKFLKHTWNPLMPKSITEKLQKLWVGGMSKRIPIEEIDNLGTYLALDFAHDEKYDEYNLPNGFKNFEAFYSCIIELMTEINKWLSKHEAEELKFREDI